MKAVLDPLGLEEKVVLLDLDPMFYRFGKVDLDQDPFFLVCGGCQDSCLRIN